MNSIRGVVATFAVMISLASSVIGAYHGIPAVSTGTVEQQNLLITSTTAISGDTMVVRGPARTVRVYEWNGASWIWQADLLSPGLLGDDFGQSLAISGDIVVVGAPQDSSSGTGITAGPVDASTQYSGAIYIFSRTGTTWTREAYIKSMNPRSFNLFGRNIAISGATVIVGSHLDDSTDVGVDISGSLFGVEVGAVEVFERNGSTWFNQAIVKSPHPAAGDQFGRSVDISGNTIVVGVKDGTTGRGINPDPTARSNSDSGSVYVFNRSGSNWTQEAYIKSSNDDPDDWFAFKLAFDNDTLAVSAYRESGASRRINLNAGDNSAMDAGAVYVFDRNNGVWSESAYLKPSNLDAGDNFGGNLALSGNRLVVHSPGEDSILNGSAFDPFDNSAINAGVFYAFERVGDIWFERTMIKEPGDLGIPLIEGPPALDGDRFAFSLNRQARVHTYDFGFRPAQPVIYVSGPVVPLPDGDTTPQAEEGTLFSSPAAGSGAQTNRLRIANIGKAQLHLGAVSITGPGAADFTVVGATGSIESMTSKEIQIVFNPTGTGIQPAIVSIGNNDPNHPQFEFAVGDNVPVVPEIHVSFNNISIGHNDQSPTFSDGTHFGSMTVGGTPLVRTFQVRNLGTGNLLLGSPSMSGSAAGDFSVSVATNTLAPNGATTLTVTFDGTADGERNAILTFPNNDADESPFAFAVRGTGIGTPEIDIVGIADGDASPSFAEGTIFGTTNIAHSLDRTFVVSNAGTANLSLGTLSITGMDATNFTILSPPGSPLPPSTVTQFRIRFTASRVGVSRATVSLANTDANENPYDFLIEATGEEDPDPAAFVAYIKANNPDAIDNFGHAVAISDRFAVVGAPNESSSVPDNHGVPVNNSAASAGAAYVFARNGTNWSQQAYLKAHNPGAGDNFGWSVAISGENILVGAPGEDGLAGSISDSGAAYVFRYNGTSWTQTGYLKASNAGPADRFGKAVAISGDTIVVGAEDEDGNATGVGGNGASNASIDSGAAYVFLSSGGTWSEQAYLKGSNSRPGDGFGGSVSVWDDTVVVGAMDESSALGGVNGSSTNVVSGSAASSGAAYVFKRNSGTWFQQALLKTPQPFAGDFFGKTVSASDGLIVVGADGDSGTNNAAVSSGSAYVFGVTNGSWTQQAYLRAGNAGAGDRFGTSVGVFGNAIVVGAREESGSATGLDGPAENDGASFSGAAYLFYQTNGVWFQNNYVKASNTEQRDRFGWSVAIHGTNLIVGAVQEDSSATGVNGNGADNSLGNSGAAYIFQSGPNERSMNAPTGSTLRKDYFKTQRPQNGGLFGSAVAVSGDLAAVGAPGEDSPTSGDQSGVVYLFRRVLGQWVVDGEVAAPPPDEAPRFGRSVGLFGETLVVGARGSVHVFQRLAAGFTHLQTLLPPKRNSAWDFGRAVAVDARHIAIGDAEAVHVFERTGLRWTFSSTLHPKINEQWDFFGSAVDIWGDHLIVGASGNDSSSRVINAGEADNSATATGSAYVFRKVGREWTQEAFLKASNGDPHDLFGNSVAIGDDYAVVSAAGEKSFASGINGNAADNSVGHTNGAVYVFTRTGGNWTQQAYIKPFNNRSGIAFGTSLAVSGDTFVVGAMELQGVFSATNQSSGTAYVYTRNGSNWTLSNYLRPSNQHGTLEFGHDVDISGRSILVGALYESNFAVGVNSAASNSSLRWTIGAAFMFSEVSGSPAIISPPSAQIQIETNLMISVVSENASGYQWYLNGAPMTGHTNSVLHRPAANRSFSGAYSVVMTGLNGDSITSSVANVRVIPRQRILSTLPVDNGSVRLRFADEFGGLVPPDLSRIELQWRINLNDQASNVWRTIDAGFVVTNNAVQYDHIVAPNLLGLRRFYRVIER